MQIPLSILSTFTVWSFPIWAACSDQRFLSARVRPVGWSFKSRKIISTDNWPVLSTFFMTKKFFKISSIVIPKKFSTKASCGNFFSDQFHLSHICPWFINFSIEKKFLSNDLGQGSRDGLRFIRFRMAVQWSLTWGWTFVSSQAHRYT